MARHTKDGINPVLLRLAASAHQLQSELGKHLPDGTYSVTVKAGTIASEGNGDVFNLTDYVAKLSDSKRAENDARRVEETRAAEDAVRAEAERQSKLVAMAEAEEQRKEDERRAAEMARMVAPIVVQDGPEDDEAA